ncbi:MAG: iron-containing alcohol dehydrogenase, partial [Clostridia bacterium]|nr:iron-containing alcohol dehydrogenase [Clostridia bacterium]
ELTGRAFRRVSACESIETVAANSADRDISVWEFYSIVAASSDEVELKCDKTLAALREVGFEWDEIGADYLAKAGELLEVSGFTPERPQNDGKLNHIQRLFLGKLADAKTHPQKTVSGAGSVARLKETLPGAHKPFVITFPQLLENGGVKAALDAFDDRFVFTGVKGEPDTTVCREAVRMFTENGCDCVAAMGGGSVLDCAKLVCLGAANPDREFEELCRLYRRDTPRVPFTAVPTTAGTGSEVTLFAVVTNDEGKKHPFASGEFLPDTVILDPELTVSVPKNHTAYTAVDALSHAVESYCSLYAPSFKDDVAHAPGAVRAIFENLPKALEDPGDLGARAALQNAAYEAGLSFRRASTGYVHAVAHRLGEIYHLPHGLAIAKAFVPVLRRSAGIEPRLAELSLACGFVQEGTQSAEAAESFIERLEELIAKTAPETAGIKVRPEDVPLIVADAQDEAKVTGYPYWFSDAELAELVSSLSD